MGGWVGRWVGEQRRRWDQQRRAAGEARPRRCSWRHKHRGRAAGQRTRSRHSASLRRGPSQAWPRGRGGWRPAAGRESGGRLGRQRRVPASHGPPRRSSPPSPPQRPGRARGRRGEPLGGEISASARPSPPCAHHGRLLVCCTATGQQQQGAEAQQKRAHGRVFTGSWALGRRLRAPWSTYRSRSD